VDPEQRLAEFQHRTALAYDLAEFQHRTALAYDNARAVNAVMGGGIDDVPVRRVFWRS
jgi:hypothetical protein